MMRKLLAIVTVALVAPAFANEAPDPSAVTLLVVSGDAATAPGQVTGQVLTFTVRRYAGAAAKEAAYRRLEDALRAMALERGLPAGGEGDGLTVEVDSSFYVYTDRFNARLVRLPEYTQAQLDGSSESGALRAEQKPDLVRIAAGTLGIVRGWISPSFGSFMIAGGATPPLFGSGKAPARLFVAGKERYERGEQEVNTKVRILKGGAVLASYSVRNWMPGDELPFQVEALVTANWEAVMSALSPRRPDIAAAQ